jgi:hypothetical protein
VCKNYVKRDICRRKPHQGVIEMAAIGLKLFNP